MTSIPVTDATYGQAVVDSDLPVVIYFWADWCGPCKQVGPALEQLSDEMAGQVKIAKLNVDDAYTAANFLGVRGLPSMFIIINGEVIANRSGSPIR